MDTLNEFVANAALEPLLAARLRRYVRSQLAAEAKAPGAELHALLDGMSPLLRTDVALSTNAALYARLPLLSAAPLVLLIELSFAFKPMSFPPGEELCRAGADARRGLVLSLQRGLLRLVDPLADASVLPYGAFVSPALLPSRASQLLIGEEALWAAAFPRSQAMQLVGCTVLSLTTASCMSLRAGALADLLAQFPEHVARMRVPVRARWLRRRLRLVVEGARRVRAVLACSRRSAESGVSFSELVRAAANEQVVGRASLTQRVLLSRRLADLPRPSTDRRLAESTLQFSPQLAVFVVSYAAPERFRSLVAAALTIQRIFRGSLVRARLRLRIARARYSTRAMQRLASKLAGKEPAVIALETLRIVHKQLLSAIEQQEQVVCENAERGAVTRERLRISQLGLAAMRGPGGTRDAAPGASSETC